MEVYDNPRQSVRKIRTDHKKLNATQISNATPQSNSKLLIPLDHTICEPSSLPLPHPIVIRRPSLGILGQVVYPNIRVEDRAQVQLSVVLLHFAGRGENSPPAVDQGVLRFAALVDVEDDPHWLAHVGEVPDKGREGELEAEGTDGGPEQKGVLARKKGV
jgi:hypothetical protein